jgi:predicted O-linked N-acetylglucosamine transferase (SPINDLY family)
MAGYFDKFYDVSLASDLDIINLARKEELDIAIDMNGCTAESHPNVFLNQVAPIQVNYLGYPGTMGTSQMDYIIADPVVIPATSQKFYSEKIAYLKCLMPHDNELELSNKNYSKTDLDLPEKAFIYCAFNNSYKINSRIWKNWMTILTRVPNSVLWLSYNSLISSKNLKKAAEAYGVDPKRLIFAHRWPDVREHFSRLSVTNLFLDTYPYNAHTTASAALWAGVPVLTMQGETFASRVASSLLITSQLPELIVTTDEDYVNLAVDLALDLQKLANIKMRLSTFRLNNPLFQTKWYTKEIENLFIQMYERKWNQQAPDNIESTQ